MPGCEDRTVEKRVNIGKICNGQESVPWTIKLYETSLGTMNPWTQPAIATILASAQALMERIQTPFGLRTVLCSFCQLISVWCVPTENIYHGHLPLVLIFWFTERKKALDTSGAHASVQRRQRWTGSGAQLCISSAGRAVSISSHSPGRHGSADWGGRWGFKALKSSISAGWEAHAQEAQAFVSELRVSGTTGRRKWDCSWVLKNGGGAERTRDLGLSAAGLAHTVWSLLVSSIYLLKSHHFTFPCRWMVFNSVLFPFLLCIHQL